LAAWKQGVGTVLWNVVARPRGWEKVVTVFSG
jgi:hypothetical protein